MTNLRRTGLTPIKNNLSRQGFKDLSRTNGPLKPRTFRMFGNTLHVGISDIVRDVYVVREDGTVVNENFLYRGGRWETF